ncbi:hypothetical protein IAU60_000540 [Kwoniella sp. DSM 27419]
MAATQPSGDQPVTHAFEPPIPSPAITPEPNLVRAEAAALVRQVYESTWREYFARKPPSTLGLSNGVVEASAVFLDDCITRAQREWGNRIVARSPLIPGQDQGVGPASSITSTGDKQGESSTSSLPIALPNYAGAYSLVSKASNNASRPVYTIQHIEQMSKRGKRMSKVKRVQLNGPLTFTPPSWVKAPPRVPAYHFCVYSERSVSKEDERAVQFRHMFEDGYGIGDFDEDAYHRMFDGRVAWEGVWRDSEADIIQVETIRRLRDKLSPEQIDSTRILPLRHGTIQDMEVMRDLPPFPSDPDQAKSPLKRKWRHPLGVDDQEYVSSKENFEELHCTRQGCTTAACARHASLNNGLLTFHSHRYSRLPQIKARSGQNALSILVTSSPACANECFLQNLRLEPTSPWPEYPRRQLIEYIAAELVPGGKVSPCKLSRAFPEYTCEQVALQIVDIWEKERTIIPEVEEEDEQMGSLKPPKVPRCLLPGQYHMLDYAECVHDGPCKRSYGCDCVERDRPCGRNCGCSLDCRRRFGGCTCRAQPGLNGRQAPAACKADRCACVKLGRECDPELCGPCGSAVELETARKVKQGTVEEIAAALARLKTQPKCGNVASQRELWPKMRVGVSPTAGYGVFADEDMRKGTVLGEYVGEAISLAEGQKRDRIDEQIGRVYLFRVNAETEIDACNLGNITRYFNTAKGADVNAVAKPFLVHDEHKILFYASKAIKRFEEIRFDYGPNFAADGTVTL